MNVVQVTHLDLLELQIYHQLRDNAFTKDNSFIADSPKVVNLLLKTAIEVKSILATKAYYDEFSHLLVGKKDVVCYVVDKALMQTIVGHKIHHNCMLHGIRPNDVSIDRLGNHVVMLDGITSSENIGSIARSASALGVDTYLVPKTSPHPFNRRALRVSMGHASGLKIHRFENTIEMIQRLQQEGYTVFAAEVTGDATPLQQVTVPEKWVLLMGHEGKGISQEVLDVCNHTVMIEMMPDVRSFNVGVATSILMYHFVQHP